MSDKKKLIEKIKAFFSETPELENLQIVEKKKKFMEVTLLSGNVISVEPTVEVGAIVTAVAEDGTVVQLPIGEYELENGDVIVVLVDGIIAEVKVKEADPVDPVDPTAEDMEAERVAKKVIESITKESIFVSVSEFEKFKLDFENLSKENDFLHKENDAIKEQFAELKGWTGKALNEIFESPKNEPLKKVVNPFSKKEKKYIWEQ